MSAHSSGGRLTYEGDEDKGWGEISTCFREETVEGKGTMGGVPEEGGQERTPGRGEDEYPGHDSKNVIPQNETSPVRKDIKEPYRKLTSFPNKLGASVWPRERE